MEWVSHTDPITFKDKIIMWRETDLYPTLEKHLHEREVMSLMEGLGSSSTLCRNGNRRFILERVGRDLREIIEHYLKYKKEFENKLRTEEEKGHDTRGYRKACEDIKFFIAKAEDTLNKCTLMLEMQGNMLQAAMPDSDARTRAQKRPFAGPFICCICFEPFSYNEVWMCSENKGEAHVVCAGCYDRLPKNIWGNVECPICRKEDMNNEFIQRELIDAIKRRMEGSSARLQALLC